MKKTIQLLGSFFIASMILLTSCTKETEKVNYYDFFKTELKQLLSDNSKSQLMSNYINPYASFAKEFTEALNYVESTNEITEEFIEDSFLYEFYIEMNTRNLQDSLLLYDAVSNIYTTYNHILDKNFEQDALPALMNINNSSSIVLETIEIIKNAIIQESYAINVISILELSESYIGNSEILTSKDKNELLKGISISIMLVNRHIENDMYNNNFNALSGGSLKDCIGFGVSLIGAFTPTPAAFLGLIGMAVSAGDCEKYLRKKGIKI